MTTARRGGGRGNWKIKHLSKVPGSSSHLSGDHDDVDLECDLCPTPTSCQFPGKDELFAHKIISHPEHYEYECGQCDDKLFERLEDLEKHFKSVHMMMGADDAEEETATAALEEMNNLEREVEAVVTNADDIEIEANDNYEDDDDDGGGGDHFEEDGGMEQDDDVDDDGGELGGNSFKCPFCPKSYPWKSELTIHLRSHTGEKPYTCEECGQAFSVYRSMVDHQKRHNKKYEYFCEVVGCGKGFVKKQDRDRHEVQGHVPLHLRQAFKNNQCEICGKNFANSTHLKIHVNAVHGKGPGYPCHLCGKSFGHQSSLRSHLQSKKHGGTGLSFRNKKKNKQPATSTAPTPTTTTLEESTSGQGNLPPTTRTFVQERATAPPLPPPPIIYPNAMLHPQFTPNYQPQPQSIMVMDVSQIQQGQGQRFSQQSSAGGGGPGPYHQQGTVTLQDAFQMAYGMGGGGIMGGSNSGTSGGPAFS